VADVVQKEILACPFCSGGLSPAGAALQCSSCGDSYGTTQLGQLDLRLQRAKAVEIRHVIGRRGTTGVPEVFRTCSNLKAEVDLSHVVLPGSISPRFASYLPRARRPGTSRVLDLGCGAQPARPLLTLAGYEYVGIDYIDSRAPILADGHALPFVDGSFELVFTVAVLEYLEDPRVALREAHRVLEPGGAMLGSAAFLTPFLWNTYLHHTHLGLLNVLASAGFRVDVLMADPDYNVIDATASMSLFPGMPRRLRKVATWPPKAAHRLWWRLAQLLHRGGSGEAERILRNAADFEFLARASPG
jgi:SAM-dependent methyltransferase